ncbi:MAG: DUF488 family protein [Candidatus Thermoplasmatota archaeon]|nr:DUF488 family protein [Candidatus Thermoplasmatota archaeon]
MIRIKRIYEKPENSDGIRILVDRLWPRGISGETGAVQIWLRDIAPSEELRKWFGHDPARFSDFQAKYFEELALNEKSDEIMRLCRDGDVTLLYSAKDQENNNAVALRRFLEDRLKENQ